MDPLDDLPPDSRREVVAAVGAALGVNTKGRGGNPIWTNVVNVGGGVGGSEVHAGWSWTDVHNLP